MRSRVADDHLIRATGFGGRIRAVAAATTATVERLREIHDPSPTVTAALGRIATGALLLAATLEKTTARAPVVTVEVEGDGPAGRFLATASPEGWVRATVANPYAEAPSRSDGKLDVSSVVGRSGRLAVTRDPGAGEPYRGVVELVSGEMAKDFAHYLNESEQTPAAVALGVFMVPHGRVEHAGGFTLQILPGVGEAEAAELTRRVTALGTVTERMRAGEGPAEWLSALFPDSLQVLEMGSARFLCGCSRGRVERTLLLLGEHEIRELLERSLTQEVDLKCEFCKTVYDVPRDDLARLLLEVESETAGRTET